MKDGSTAESPQDGAGHDGAGTAPGTTPPTERRLVTRRRPVRRPLGGAFWLTALLLAAAVAAGATYTQRAGVESALGADVDQRLAAKGLGKVEVRLEGRSVTAAVPAGEDEEKVERVVAGVSGVADVETTQAFASAKQRRTCQMLDQELDRATNKQQIPFAGSSAQLTSEGQTLVLAAARVLRECPVGDVVVGGHSDDDTPDFSTLSLERARVMVELLKRNGVDGARLEARGYGDQFPVDEADTAAAVQRNQRGEISAEGS